MFCGLGEEQRTKIRKKKKWKKEKKMKKNEKKNLIAAKSGWLDERVSWDIQPYEIFFAVGYLNRFWLRSLFTQNLRGGFRVLKPKSRDPIASKFGTNI